MPIGENEDELWDVYDSQRRRTGKTHRRGDPLKAGEYHLVVHICVFNSRGQLLIQKRQPWKKGFPGYWDLSTGGSALAGDDSRTAAQREVKEELGLDVDLSEEEVRFTFRFPNGFDDYWMIRYDVELSELHLQYEEVADARWADRDEVARLVQQGKFVPYYFIDRIFDIFEGTGAIDDRQSEKKEGYER